MQKYLRGAAVGLGGVVGVMVVVGGELSLPAMTQESR